MRFVAAESRLVTSVKTFVNLPDGLWNAFELQTLSATLRRGAGATCPGVLMPRQKVIKFMAVTFIVTILAFMVGLTFVVARPFET